TCPVHHRTAQRPHLSELQRSNPNGLLTSLFMFAIHAACMQSPLCQQKCRMSLLPSGSWMCSHQELTMEKSTVVVCVPVVIMAEIAEIDYSSSFSVFTMEAYDLLGGDACSTQMYSEAKLASVAATVRRRVEKEERDYLSHDKPRTVLSGKACNDLDGEFCDAPYQ
ncbi:hypothetical protein ACJX0J_020671, partial [Zea mays]